MPTDCNFQTKLEKERVSLAEFFSVLEGYKSDARGIIPTSYHKIINICYFMKTLLHRVNTWKSAKNIPPLFIFKSNESATYLQGQRDFMRILLVAAPWSKKWTNTMVECEFAEILHSLNIITLKNIYNIVLW